MTHRPQLIKTQSAGRPMALIPGTDGHPLRLQAATRRSTSAPGRVKVHLVGAADMPDVGVMPVKLATFRLELN